MSVNKKHTTSERMTKAKVPFRIAIGENKDMMTIIRELQKRLKDVVAITLKGDNKHCH